MNFFLSFLQKPIFSYYLLLFCNWALVFLCTLVLPHVTFFVGVRRSDLPGFLEIDPYDSSRSSLEVEGICYASSSSLVSPWENFTMFCSLQNILSLRIIDSTAVPPLAIEEAITLVCCVLLKFSSPSGLVIDLFYQLDISN